MLKPLFLLTAFMVPLLQVSGPALAAEPCARNVSADTSKISTPDQIRRPPVVNMLGCKRPFMYKGDVYSADTAQAQDAGTLKELMLDTPDALETLNDYNRNRKLSKISAYTGTFGLLTFALAGIVAAQFIQPDRDSIRSAMTIGGMAIAAGGFLYSFTLLRTNEYLIPKAVNQYNAKHPNEPIELRFEAGWSF